MEPAIRGLVLDSSVLVAAERANLTTPQVIRNIRDAVPVEEDVPIVISALTLAELAHETAERSHRRRQFVDELKTDIPVHPITEPTAEIIARVGGEQAAKGVNLLWPISSSERALWNSATRSGPAIDATSIESRM